METAKGSQQYKFEHFDVTLTVFSEKKVQITVIDPFEKMEFHEALLTLENIGTTTLSKALEKKLIEVKMGMKVNKTPENAILQIDVLVASQFLKPVQETIYLKKRRDISQSEILQSSVSVLSAKIKALKESDKNAPNIVRCGTVQTQDKIYNNGTIYENIGGIRLPKGKHVLTISFLAKATNSWMYLYFQQGQQMIQNCGFYVPTNSNFIPFVVRKQHTVNANEEMINFTTYYGQSYPVTLRNVVVTAQQVL